MENSIIMRKTVSKFEQNDRENLFIESVAIIVSCIFCVFNIIPKIFDLTSNVKNSIFFY
jgi:hypothetical protein